MAYQRCSACKGKKRYLGMGILYKDCTHCKGVGFEDVPDSKLPPEMPEIEIEKQLLESTEPPKKRGRKPKISANEVFGDEAA